MYLPIREKAYVPKNKLSGYLLSNTHADGKGKAKFFREFGFTNANAPLLEEGLLYVAKNEEISTQTKSPFGVKYIIDGSLITPVGISVNIRTVWIIEKGEDIPRFVTAHPISKSG